MPELAEVEWYRKQWNPGIGDRVVAVKLHAGKYILRDVGPRALRQLIGKTLIGSERHGKQMLFRFSGGLSLGIHLGMTGKMRTEPADFRPGKYDHLVMYQPKRALVFADTRQLGRVRIHAGVDQPGWWKSDPPQIESSDFDQDFFEGFLKRHAKAPIKAVLLMQGGFAGIGNWMADEILWRAGVLPAKRTFRLTDREREKIFSATKFVVKQALATTGKDFSDPPGDWLIHQKWKRDGVCPKHRTPLRHATIGGRSTAWCHKCQK
ncbi:MAG TPA: DNA-formamidopyrimidine glycosylase family protein [Chthoniobacterales bacterium]|jgi:formamidopyrimidine-DNA glycosylase